MIDVLSPLFFVIFIINLDTLDNIVLKFEKKQFKGILLKRIFKKGALYVPTKK